MANKTKEATGIAGKVVAICTTTGLQNPPRFMSGWDTFRALEKAAQMGLDSTEGLKVIKLGAVVDSFEIKPEKGKKYLILVGG